jgi:16S rRNA (guanine527-N7)-methyltransferase
MSSFSRAGQKSQTSYPSAHFSQVWTRHLAGWRTVAWVYAPFARRWVDLGSGAGFPEMVVAILLAEMQGARKFIALKVIRENARSTGGHSCDRCSCPHGGRIEMFDPCWLSLVDAVTSRARAPLPSLVELANELLMLRAVGNLPRGRSAAAETETFSVASQFQFKSFRNNFDPDARIDCVDSRDSHAQAQK